MNDYEVVAFFRTDKTEISAHAENLCKLYRLQLRYEQMPGEPFAVSALLNQNTVLCMLDRTTFGFRKMMRYVYAIDKPVIIVHRNDSPDVYNCLKVPVGYLQENKEKVVWANFFHHHNGGSRIELVVPKEKDEDIAIMIANNVRFIEQILHNSKSAYEKCFLEGSFEKNLKRIFRDSSDCVVFLMRPFRIFSWHLPYNIRLFRKYAHTPTMIIPRDEELYIPCH